MIEQKTFIPGAAIFDMDGLMLDTEKPLARVWVQAAKELGWQVSEELMYSTVGIDEAGTKAIILREYGADFPYQEIREKSRSILIEKAEREGIAHRPGLALLLDHLDRLGVPLAVATSTGREAALWKMEKGGIAGRFSVMVFGDEVKNGKPAPDIFLLAAQRLGKTPGQCVGFEDSPAGLRGLHSAGIQSVFVKDTVEPPQEVLAGVWRRLDSLADALALFG